MSKAAHKQVCKNQFALHSHDQCALQKNRKYFSYMFIRTGNVKKTQAVSLLQ